MKKQENLLSVQTNITPNFQRSKQMTKQKKVRQFKQFKESNQFNQSSQPQTQIFSFYQNEQDLDIQQINQSFQLYSPKFNKKLFSRMQIKDNANPQQMMFLVKCKKTIQILNQRLSKIEKQKQKTQKDNVNKNLLIRNLLIQKQNMQMENQRLKKIFENQQHKINKKNFKLKQQNIQPRQLAIRQQIGTQTEVYISRNLKSAQQSLRDYECQLHLYEINLKNQMITHLTESYNQLQKKYSQQLLKVNQVTGKVNQLKKSNILEEGLMLQKLIKKQLELKKTKNKCIQQKQQRQIDFIIKREDKQIQDSNTQIAFNHHKQKQTQNYQKLKQDQNYHKQKQTEKTVKKKTRIREQENQYLTQNKEKQLFKDQFINIKVDQIKRTKQQQMLFQQNVKENQIQLSRNSQRANIYNPQTWNIISNSFNLLESYLQKLNTLSNTETQ